MNLICVGLSHHTAPVELRERLAYSTGSLKATLARLGCGREASDANLRELAILSTCNRLELYGIVHGDGAAAMLDLVADTTSTARAEFEPFTYRHVGAEAVRHLCQVAAGLDSLVLGEPQILGQVVEAYEAARSQGAAGPILSALFRTAIHAGKRARSETGISRNPATISSVAVSLMASVVDDLAAARVLIVGAGEMAMLAAEALRARGTRSLTVVNRTHERAAQFARLWAARTMTFEQLEAGLAEADIVITSTAAPHVLVGTALVSCVMQARPTRPLLFVDIAVPRNVDPGVADVTGVHYYDIDDLQARLNGSLAGRHRERPLVEAIIETEVQEFVDWQKRLDIAPLLADLRSKAEAIRRAEVEKTMRHLPRLDDAERQRVEALTEALVNKLLHDPTERLKAVAGNGHAAEYAGALRDLFALND